MSGRNSPKRNSGIDTLRGISILSVILLHNNTRVPFSDTALGGLMPSLLYKILFWSGYYGVCIFFTVSGFLITTSAFSKWNSLPRIKPFEFYTMRFARIMPLLVSLMAVLSILHLEGVKGFVINPSKVSLVRSIVAAITFHINILEIKIGYMPGSWDILWSLSIEEIFYLFFPIVCLISRKEWTFAAVVSVFLVISPFARTVWAAGNELGDRNYFAYMDAIALGCIAAIIAKRIDIRKPVLNIMMVVGWAMFLLVMVARPISSMMNLGKTGLNVTVLAIGTALILIRMQKRLVNGEQKPLRVTAFLRFLGKNSYEIYLTHMFVVTFLFIMYLKFQLGGEWAWGFYSVSILLSGILGEIVARYLSQPLNSLIRSRVRRVYGSDVRAE